MLPYHPSMILPLKNASTRSDPSLPQVRPTEPSVLSEPVRKIKFAVAPGCPWLKIAPVPPWTISTRSMVSSKRMRELLSMKDRYGAP